MFNCLNKLDSIYVGLRYILLLEFKMFAISINALRNDEFDGPLIV